MEAVKTWKCSRRRTPRRMGRGTFDGGGGNWGGPPRPGDLRMVLPERGVL